MGLLVELVLPSFLRASVVSRSLGGDGSAAGHRDDSYQLLTNRVMIPTALSVDL